ncbi:MAG TPA: YncE family protein, partial [Nitrososphaeraceae archaeon]
IPLAEGSYNFDINPTKSLVYVASNHHDLVNVINTSSSIKNLRSIKNSTVAVGPYSTAINPVNNKIYVVNEKMNRISVIDSNNNNTLKNIILNSSSLAEEPRIAVDPKTDFIFVSNPKEGKILVVDDKTARVLTSLEGGVYPTNLKLNTIDDTLYVTSLSDPINILNVTKDSIIKELGNSKLNEKREKRGIIFDEAPITMAIDPVTNKIYAIYDSQKKISVIDGTTNKINNTINLDFVPSAIDINPRTNTLFTIWNNTVYAIDTISNRIIHNFTVGSTLDDIAIDTKNNQIYLHGEVTNLNKSPTNTEGYHSTAEFQIDVNKYQETSRFKSSKYLNPDPLIYVFNKGGDTIATDNNINITLSTRRHNPEDITALDYNPVTNLAYILTDHFLYIVDFDTSSLTNIKMDNIFKSGLVVNPNSNLIYISDSLRNTVEVFNGTDNKIITNIPVGFSPSQMKINTKTNTIYVINKDSNTVSVIDGSLKKVIIPSITFNVHPANAGYIKCDNEDITTNRYVRIGYDTPCIALPNKGFEFSNWVEILDRNSTTTISAITKSNYWYSPLWNWIKSVENNLGFETPDNAATFPVSKSGNFTANFEKMPPPIPSEYLIPLYGVVISTIVGWSIPSIIGWTRSRSEARKLNLYHTRISSIYSDGRLDESDIELLDKIRGSIADAYSKGKINKEHYESLKNEISTLYEEIFRKRIDSLEPLGIEAKEKLKQIRNNIEDKYSKGKLVELHYKLLNKRIEEHDDKPKKSEQEVG